MKSCILFIFSLLPLLLPAQEQLFVNPDRLSKQIRNYEELTGIDFHLIERNVLNNGVIHQKIQFEKNGIPLFGAIALWHESHGNVRFLSHPLRGKSLYFDEDLNWSPDEIIKEAIDAHNGTLYAWQDPGTEAILKQQSHDEKASFYPSPELIYIDRSFPEFSGHFILAYRLRVYSLQPLSQKEYFISAADGNILYASELIHSTEVEGIAHTKYSGIRSIKTDSVGPGHFILNENSRGGGIQTLNMRNSILYDNAIDFSDSNNIWNNYNEQMDEVATDAHWGMEMTYDFYNQKLNWKSFDNRDSKMLAFVHFSTDYVNAFWNGRWTTYGDGRKAAGYEPLVTLDVVGHEFTHGVVDYTADLIYRNESGALNESFCDIFGSAIEHFADTSLFNWWIGEGFTKNGIRSMENPKFHGNPDTYHGENWEYSAFDNGGVHINSGVQNKWFQLLSDGGSGTNDNGDTFAVEGLGIDAAARIAFQNLRYYLSVLSQYRDARNGSIEAAIELFGISSNAVRSVIDAWYAVGLGYPARPGDLALEAILAPAAPPCNLSSGEVLSLEIRNNSLLDTIHAGTALAVSYIFGNDTSSAQNYTIDQEVLPYERFMLDSLGILDMSAPGKKELTVIIGYAGDPEPRNDTLRKEFSTAEHQITDLRLFQISNETERCIDLSTPEYLQVVLRYEGCDSFPAASVPMFFTINGDTLRDTAIIGSALYPGNNEYFTFSTPLPVSEVGTYTVKAVVAWPGDQNLENNSKEIKLKRSAVYDLPAGISFEDYLKSADSLLLISGRDASVSIRGSARNKGLYGLFFTGGKVFENRHGYTEPDSSTIWTLNTRFSAKACICVDATDFPEAFDLQFDLRQTYSPAHEQLVFKDLPYASAFRVTADGRQISPSYLPKTHVDDTFRTITLPMDTFAGRMFTLCFESRNLIADNDAVDTGKGDNAYLDNVRLRSLPLGLPLTGAKTRYNLDISPNPVSGDELYLEFDAARFPERIRVFNIWGRELIVAGQAETSDSRINISGLRSGVYFIRAEWPDAVVSRPFVRVQ